MLPVYCEFQFSGRFSASDLLFSLRGHRPETLPAEQAVHLLAAKVFDDGSVGDTRDALKIGPGKTDPEPAAF